MLSVYPSLDSECDWLASPLDTLLFLPSDSSPSLPSADPDDSPDSDESALQDAQPEPLDLLLPDQRSDALQPLFAVGVKEQLMQVAASSVPAMPRLSSPASSAPPLLCRSRLPPATLASYKPSPASSSFPLPPSKLTLGQKLDIVRRSEAPKHDLDYRSPSELARMYGKSRSSISKILRPSYVRRLKQLAASGVSTDIRRSTSTLHPELERRIHEYVVRTARGASWRQEVCRYAEGVAEELGIEGFKASLNWYHRFIARHSLKGGSGCGGSRRK